MTLECPKCKSPVARDGQRFCYRCGHELNAYYDSLKIKIEDPGATVADIPQPSVATGEPGESTGEASESAGGASESASGASASTNDNPPEQAPALPSSTVILAADAFSSKETDTAAPPK